MMPRRTHTGGRNNPTQPGFTAATLQQLARQALSPTGSCPTGCSPQAQPATSANHRPAQACPGPAHPPPPALTLRQSPSVAGFTRRLSHATPRQQCSCGTTVAGRPWAAHCPWVWPAWPPASNASWPEAQGRQQAAGRAGHILLHQFDPLAERSSFLSYTLSSHLGLRTPIP